MTHETMMTITTDETERRKEIAHDIYHQIKTSLHRQLEHAGPEGDTSLIRELHHEARLARRALVHLGVEVA